MRIISRRTLREFFDRQPKSKPGLEAWYAEVKHAHWKSPTDVLSQFPKARIVGKDRILFDILGNRYRLVVRVNYVAGIVLIRFVGTHKEYDRIDVEEV
ncbi:MAG TPA: type II toxin-antitoxin system HigB family toxin [Spirochaetia bacterium]|nr:type II toxin-antitoxin system HigB family toxin [Spirochaetia bacterium]